jgi:RNA polymerase sigma-70 factor (ECF subfamily)
LNPSNDAELISHCRAGDPAAVETLVRAHQTFVYRLALSMLDDPAEADEATQETFVAAIRRLDSFRGDSTLTTWLYAIALNVCRGRLRKRRVRERLAQTLHMQFRADLETQPHAEQVVAERETNEALWRAVSSLDDGLREVVVLRYYHELRLADVAKAVGVSERTVRARLYAAYEKMRRVLQETIEPE